MGDIYASAVNVRVWLGKDTADLDAFTWVNTELYEALEASERPTDDLAKRHPFDPAFYHELGIAISHQVLVKTWVSYWCFIRRRRFFYRAWIVQEVILARNVLIQCDGQHLSGSLCVRSPPSLSKVGGPLYSAQQKTKFGGLVIGGDWRDISIGSVAD
jgi:Heterokaryon incompatibility protein (HET)